MKTLEVIAIGLALTAAVVGNNAKAEEPAQTVDAYCQGVALVAEDMNLANKIHDGAPVALANLVTTSTFEGEADQALTTWRIVFLLILANNDDMAALDSKLYGQYAYEVCVESLTSAEQ